MEGSILTTQAIGTVPSGARSRCMFCNTLIENEGAPYIDHLRASPDCMDAYGAWLDNLDLDRPGGG
jgi:hypothetical protein